VTLSLARTGDETILEHVRAIDDIGADVQVTTEEESDQKGSLIRTVRITWITHNTDGRVLG
jgi:hypothetical protein